jgi:hypothetical protein
MNALSVFLCHSTSDKEIVRELCKRLRADGVDPWLDEEKLVPGQIWADEIGQAVRTSDVVIVCLSNHAVTKEGFVQKEIKYALDTADEKPDGTIFLIPLRLERCNVPLRLRQLQWVDYFDVQGYQKLMSALEQRARALGRSFGVEFRHMTRGDFQTYQIAVIAEALQKDRDMDFLHLLFCCLKCGSPRLKKQKFTNHEDDEGIESMAVCLDCDWGYTWSSEIAWGHAEQKPLNELVRATIDPLWKR